MPIESFIWDLTAALLQLLSKEEYKPYHKIGMLEASDWSQG
jgi:hypothetical protein